MTTRWTWQPIRPTRHHPSTSGFTLIEMMVVTIIMGLLAAIALPAFLNQVQKAHQAKATAQIGAVNRAQQAYRLSNPTFANTLAVLDIGIPEDTDAYHLRVSDSNSDRAVVEASPKNSLLLGFSGVVYVNYDNAQNATAIASVCKGHQGQAPTLNFTDTPQGPMLISCNDL